MLCSILLLPPTHLSLSLSLSLSLFLFLFSIFLTLSLGLLVLGRLWRNICDREWAHLFLFVHNRDGQRKRKKESNVIFLLLTK
jgi:hypothetical protein